MSTPDEQLRYPVGRYQAPQVITKEERETWIREVETLPARLKAEISGLSDEELETPYRPGGWTVRQVVHHLADSHVNSYQRFRLALTEDSPPLIFPYNEAAWAELPDAKSASPDLSLLLLTGLHARWVTLLRSLDDAAFTRTFRHPVLGEKRLDWTLALYAWHGRHHLAHIQISKNLAAAKAAG